MAETSRTAPIQFRSRELAAWLEARAARGRSHGDTAKIALERYAELLARELATVRLCRAEALLVCDACRGTLWEPHTMPLLWAEVADACRLRGLATTWGVDGDALVATLQGLSYGQACAVVDAVERFWQGALTEDYDVGLRRVGLLAEEETP